MKTLKLHKIDRVDHLISPEEFSDLGLHSPALSLITDFKRHEPFVVDGWMPAVDAERYMRQSHGRLRLVIDQAGEFIGTITLDDLAEGELLKKVAQGENRQEIQVTDLMKPRHEISALIYDDIRKATVADIIDTLRCSGERHCLVVDDKHHWIRGLIAASDIALRLHIEFDFNSPPSFADILAVVQS